MRCSTRNPNAANISAANSQEIEGGSSGLTNPHHSRLFYLLQSPRPHHVQHFPNNINRGTALTFHCAHGHIHSTRVSQYTCIAACLSPSSLSRGRFAPHTQWFSQSACAFASASVSRVIDSLGCLGFGLGFICSIQQRTIALICSIIQTISLNRYRYDPDKTCNNCSAACQPTGTFISYRIVAAFSLLHCHYNLPLFTIRSLMPLQA